MSWLTDDQLAAMRDDVANLLPGTAIISSMTAVADGAGGWAETWAAVSGGTVACRLDPVTGRSGIVTVPGREGLIVQYQLTVPYDAPIAVNRRVTVGGDTFEIVQLSDDHSWRVSRRALLSRID